MFEYCHQRIVDISQNLLIRQAISFRLIDDQVKLLD